MRFEVPQFIEMEDKIFGPLTWRQFVYLGGGVGAAVAMFIVLPFILFVIFGIPLALLSAALAFFPVNSRPFSFFLQAVYDYLRNKRLYLWRQNANHTYSSAPQKTIAEIGGTRPVSTPKKTTNKKSITSLARRLELEALQKPQ
jgi:hypothetical protein